MVTFLDIIYFKIFKITNDFIFVCMGKKVNFGERRLWKKEQKERKTEGVKECGSS